MGSKIGLVLSGGGAKGAYEIGVWKALEEFGLSSKIEVVAGTSVGALNTALFIEGNIQKAEEVWLSIKPLQLYCIHPLKLWREMKTLGRSHPTITTMLQWIGYVFTNGLLCHSGLIKLIRNNINLSHISKSSTLTYAAACESLSSNVTYFNLKGCSYEKILSILLASAAIPGLFEPIEIEGKYYVDGGIIDNTPIQPVYDAGCDLIFVIYLHPDGKSDPINYPNAKIIDIAPKTKLSNYLNGLVWFTKKDTQSRIAQGYEDTKQILKTLR